MNVTGEAGRVYRVEASVDLKSWTTIGNVTGAATAQPFTDSEARNIQLRFYRIHGD